jgi:hypothetical protein
LPLETWKTGIIKNLTKQRLYSYLKSDWRMLLMTEDKDKEEIVVKAPSKPVVSPEAKAEKAIEKALEEERFGTLQISKNFGSYFWASAIAAGVSLLCIFAFVAITGQAGWISMSSEAAVFSTILWVFVGIVNIVGGFLLMGGE